MPLFQRSRRRLERGATLTGYTLTLAVFVVVSIAAVEGLTDSSTAYLEDTGDSIGDPRPSKEELGVTSLTPPSGPAQTTATPAAPTYSSQYSGQFVANHTQTATDPGGLCIGPAPSNAVVQQTCSGAIPQTMEVFTNDITGTDQLRLGGKCLGLENDSSSNGDVVTIETCIDGDETQLWEAISGERWRNVHSGKCLDVEGSGGDGAAVMQYDCHGNDNQKWVQPGPYVSPTTAVLSVSANSVTPNGTFQLDGDGNLWAPPGTGNSYDSPGNGSATFSFTVTEAGDYKIQGSVFAPSGGDNSFWVTTSLSGDQYKWAMPVSGSFQNDFVNTANGSGPDVVVTIAANTTVEITVWKREDGTKLADLGLIKVN